MPLQSQRIIGANMELDDDGDGDNIFKKKCVEIQMHYWLIMRN